MAKKYSDRVVKAAKSLVLWASVEDLKTQLTADGSKNVALDMKSVWGYLSSHEGAGGDAEFAILVDRLRVIGGDAYRADELKIAFDTVQCELRVRGYFEQAKDRARARRNPDTKGDTGQTPTPVKAEDEFSKFIAARAAKK